MWSLNGQSHGSSKWLIFRQSLFFECAEETKSIERRETGGASCLFKGTVLRDFLAHRCQVSLVPTLLSGDRVDG